MNMKKILIVAVALVCVAALIFGGIKLFGNKDIENVEVINVTDRLADEATAELEEMGFRVDRQEAFSDMTPGAVIRQDPESGTSVPKGTTIIIVVSKGLENIVAGAEISVPNSEVVSLGGQSDTTTSAPGSKTSSNSGAPANTSTSSNSGAPANTSQKSGTSSTTTFSAPTSSTPTTNVNNVTITYNAMKGNVSPASHTVAQGSNITLPTPNRSGYRFDGWFNGEIGGIRIGGAGDSYKAMATTTLFAQWTNKTTSLLDLTPRRFALSALPVIKTDVQDAFGNKYDYALLCTASGEFRNVNVSCIYDLDSKYNTFSATIVKYTNIKSNQQTLTIFGDNKPIYQNIKIHETTGAYNISIDVTNIKELRVEMMDQCPGENNEERGFIIANPKLLLN